MTDPQIPWLTVLGASLIASGALILISRGDQLGMPWLALLGAALIAIIALVGAALADPLPLPLAGTMGTTPLAPSPLLTPMTGASMGRCPRANRPCAKFA
jgi:hypothetical protein